LGVAGACLFLLVLLYPLRQRWPWLARQVNPRHWLDLHILFGLTAVAAITFHSSFKLRGIVGVAYWIMLAVVFSGIVGRYLYNQIPRRLDAAEMSLREIEEASARQRVDLEELAGAWGGGLAARLRLPRTEEVREMSLPRVLWLLVYLDLKRVLLVWMLGCAAGALWTANLEMRLANRTMRKQAALAKKVLFLTQTRRLFRLWHVVHLPFAGAFALLSALHIIVVLLLGF